MSTYDHSECDMTSVCDVAISVSLVMHLKVLVINITRNHFLPVYLRECSRPDSSKKKLTVLLNIEWCKIMKYEQINHIAIVLPKRYEVIYSTCNSIQAAIDNMPPRKKFIEGSIVTNLEFFL